MGISQRLALEPSVEQALDYTLRITAPGLPAAIRVAATRTDLRRFDTPEKPLRLPAGTAREGARSRDRIDVDAHHVGRR
jgi:hypothetical protein